MGTLQSHLTGSRWVRALRPSFQDARHWLPRTKDRSELRRHSLKLRFWPEHHPTDESGRLQDLDWSWIKSLKGLRIGELRIADTIGGCDNLRVIFYDPDIPGEPLPTIWVLAVLQKKRDDFSKGQLATFKLRRNIVRSRFFNL